MTVGKRPVSALRRFREFARAERLFRPGPLVVAVSGGTDSTALLLLLSSVAEREILSLHVAHFDHQLRPVDGAADAEFVANLAQQCNAKFHLGQAANAPRGEDSARKLRYEFLRTTAADVGARMIATGHTRDDQAETVLLHLTRGAGLTGIAGIRPSGDGLIRPMLALRRSDTEAVCAGAGIKPRHDASNDSLEFARNRVRHRVLPELAEINPLVVDSLARLADISAEVTKALQEQVGAALSEAATDVGIDLDRLPNDSWLRSETLARAWKDAVGGSLTTAHRASLVAQSRRRDGSASIDLPGGRAERKYGLLQLIKTEPTTR